MSTFESQWSVDVSRVSTSTLSEVSTSTLSEVSTFLATRPSPTKENPLNRRSALIGWIGESGLLIG